MYLHVLYFVNSIKVCTKVIVIFLFAYSSIHMPLLIRNGEHSKSDIQVHRKVKNIAC
jgi:hypothetical protein